MASQVVKERRIAIKRACGLFSVSQTCYRYRATLLDDNARIADWLLRLAYANRTWGFGLCFLWPRNVGHALQSQTCVSHLSATGAEFADQAEAATEAGQAAGLGGAATDQ